VFLGGSFVGYVQERISMWLYGEPDPGGLDGAVALILTVILLVAAITGFVFLLIGIGTGVERLVG
jgi:hypothetical protein